MADKQKQPTDGELEVLQVLWEIEPATVRDVHEVLIQHKEIGYTTTLKQMQRLLDKKLVKRNTRGKVHTYRSLKKAEIQANLFDRLVNTAFGGSAMKLVMHALGQGKAKPEEIEALEKWLDQQKNNRNE